MNKNYITLLLLLMLPSFIYSQCSGGSSFSSVSAPANSNPLTISTCNWAGDYNTILNCVSGISYTFGASISTYITIRQGSPTGSLVGYGFAPVTITSPINGSLYMIINSNVSCANGSTCITTQITNATLLSVDNFTKETEVVLYPNPVERVLNISMPNNTKFFYTIFSLLGQPLKSDEVTPEINVSNLTSGMYILEIKDGEKSIVKKFYKK
jgi:hypothetical protein